MLKVENLRVGLKVWFKSKNTSAIITSFAGAMPETEDTIVNVLVPSENTVYACKAKQLTYSADNLFTIGDVVKSTCGDFTGKVTSFESGTNRVICKPVGCARAQLGNTDRSRYAYKPYEIHVVPATIVFTPGNHYILVDGTELLCTSEHAGGTLHLVDVQTGECLAGVESRMPLDALVNTPLEAIVELSR